MEYALIKPYGKTELANMYGINIKTLHAWLQAPGLQKDLFKFGYRKYQRQFTAKQIEIIFSHLSPPDAPSEQIGKQYIKVEIKPYTRSQLARFYGWGLETFNRYFKNSVPKEVYVGIFSVGNFDYEPLMNESKRIFTINDVEQIFSWLGHPYKVAKTSKNTHI